jgi:hypothetical protein
MRGDGRSITPHTTRIITARWLSRTGFLTGSMPSNMACTTDPTGAITVGTIGVAGSS